MKQYNVPCRLCGWGKVAVLPLRDVFARMLRSR